MLMDVLSRESLHSLMETQPDPCISLFMPTDRTGVEGQQDQLRIRRLLREAGSLLRSNAQLHTAQVEALLAPLRELVDDQRFWRHVSDGLAIFRSLHLLRVLRLPSSFREQVVVGNRFLLKPLLPPMAVSTSSHSPTTLFAC